MRTMNILVSQGRGSMPGIAETLRQDEATKVTRCSGDVPDGELLKGGGYDLLLVDLRNSYGEFPAVADAFRQSCPQATILVAAGPATAALAMEALRRGACHFVVHPEDDGQLRSMVHRVAQGGPVNLGDRYRDAVSQGGSSEGRLTLYEMEKSYILRTLEECKWNKKRTASVLGINRSSLYSKIKRFGIGAESMN